jgi:Ca2+-binding RTX toxin-like protein
MLYGGKGKDVLIGGIGSDTFVFDTAIGKDVDTIKDFQAFDAVHSKDDDFDLIYLSKSIFKKLTAEVDPEVPEMPFGKLVQRNFWIGPKAHDKDDRVIYHAKTGGLFYDPDGNGPQKQVKFALLSKGLLLSNNDFLVYA